LILVDTSVWIDHLRFGDPQLAVLLGKNSVLVHPFIIGELALGTLCQPELILTSLAKLPAALQAKDSEVLELIRRWKIAGSGIGYIDAHLLASVMLTVGAFFWTRDKRLREVAMRLSVAASLV
jgi:predicted nucleic acid-binding protein